MSEKDIISRDDVISEKNTREKPFWINMSEISTNISLNISEYSETDCTFSEQR